MPLPTLGILMVHEGSSRCHLLGLDQIEQSMWATWVYLDSGNLLKDLCHCTLYMDFFPSNTCTIMKLIMGRLKRLTRQARGDCWVLSLKSVEQTVPEK